MPESSSESKRVPGAKRLERLALGSSSNRGKAYQGALEAVFSIVIATLLGYWADRHFETAPRYLIIGAVVGFSSFVLRLVRMASLVEPVAAADKEKEETDQATSRDEEPSSRPPPGQGP